MKNKLKKYIKEILSFIIIAVIFSNIISYYRSSSLNQEKLPLQEIVLHDKPLIVHFWATWCPICKIEAPNIQMISKDYNTLTIAVESGNDKDILNYLKENNLNFKVLNDESSQYARQFNVSVFPTTLIYDKHRNLVFSEVGYTSTIALYLRMWWINFKQKF